MLILVMLVCYPQSMTDMSLTNIEMAMLDALTLARSRKTGSESSLLLFCMVERTITLRTVMMTVIMMKRLVMLMIMLQP